jgi:hypothetical protein
MAIIVKHDAQRIEKVTVKELSYNIQFTTTDNNKQVERFEIINDNLPNCVAHTKVLRPEEMMAIYEYMKKIVEKA